MRIAIAGIHGEQSGFSMDRAGFPYFTITRGEEIADLYDFPGELGELVEGVEFVGTVRALGAASGEILADVYDSILEETLASLREQGPFDGVFLHMHGAVGVEGRERAEEHYIGAIREVVGDDVVISASMDTHGNFSRELADLLDLVATHRHAPHIDSTRSPIRAVQQLIETIRRGEKPLKAFVRVPVLLPGERTSTAVEPGRTVFGKLLPSIEAHGVLDANLWVGFAWRDEERNAAAAMAVGYDEAAIVACAEELAKAYWDAQEQFVIVSDHFGPWEEALDFVVGGAPGQVWISDAGDNVTAGASGDVTYALARTSERQEAHADKRWLFAGLFDPETVGAAVEAGVGGAFTRAIGAVKDDRYEPAFSAEWTVDRFIDGVTLDGSVGPIAALIHSGNLSVSVQLRPTGFIPTDDTAAGPDYQKSTWFDPAGFDVVVVKNGYLFPGQVPFATSAFMALTPGGTDLDFDRLEFTKVQRPMFPFDRGFEWDLTAEVLAPRTSA